MGRLNASCDSIERLSMGAYVLGALDPVERARFEEHAGGCATCREELAQLSGLPGLLSRLTVEEALGAPAAPVRPFRRSRQAMLASLTAVAAVAAALVLALSTGDDTGAPGVPRAVNAVDRSTGVTATMALRPADWGTEVRVRLRGVPAGTHCRLVAVARDGSRETAGTWRADYEGHADVRTATSIPRSDLASLDVVASDGRQLVHADL